MQISYWESFRGARLNGLSLASAIERVLTAEPGASRGTVIEAALARLGWAVDQIAAAIREPESPAGLRLREDLADQLDWLVHAGHVHEITTEEGEARYTTR